MNNEILQYVDYAFLIIVAIFALLTPKDSEYHRLNKLILAMGCVFIGLTEIQLYLDIERSWMTCLANALLSLRFSYLFWPFSSKHIVCDNVGQYIAFLCVSMALFHMGNIFTGYSDSVYAAVMICFQVLLLMAASWGVIDGNSNRVDRWFRVINTWYNAHFRRQRRS